MKEIIEATKAGAPNLPISVKTRIGLREIITEEWAGFLLTQGLAALTIHGRTVREMSKVPAHWDEIRKVAELARSLDSQTLIIGNGDIESRAHGPAKATDTGVDGIMIGRGMFHDPFVFAHSQKDINPAERISILLRHLELYEMYASPKPFQTLKKFFKIYVHSWPGAHELRTELMNMTTPQEVRDHLKVYAPPHALS